MYSHLPPHRFLHIHFPRKYNVHEKILLITINRLKVNNINKQKL